ncbi:hypothetical protein CBR_g48500 [Chara braunii]|uniref:Annexin n=1 Tax=Chara braunii TaxID=69332 RepID=A0A388M2S4_CHABU|nr:hypothetical protein CBR_g48500 [Chara braunii]|eukprot:GBG88888.1 hypothetical protein CBR_g48500 [Chara braunii]
MSSSEDGNLPPRASSQDCLFSTPDEVDTEFDAILLHDMLVASVARSCRLTKRHAHAAAERPGFVPKTSVMKMLVARTPSQREAIIATYRTLYGRYLLQDIRANLGGIVGQGLITLLQPPAFRDAGWIRKAVTRVPTNENLLREVLCARNNKEIRDIHVAYKEMFARDLYRDIKTVCSGKFRDLLLKILRARRSEAPAEEVRAEEIARDLRLASINAYNGCDTEDEESNRDLFVDVFTKESVSQLRLVMEIYQKDFSEPVQDAIARTLTGHLMKAVKFTSLWAQSEAKYFAHLLHDALFPPLDERKSVRTLHSISSRTHSVSNIFHRAVCGLQLSLHAPSVQTVPEETTEVTVPGNLPLSPGSHKPPSCNKTFLIRIIMSRCDLDIDHVADEFELAFAVPLKTAFTERTEGDFRDLLSTACGF